MRVVCVEKVKHICLMCFINCGDTVLKDHHHCCDSCEDKFLEITVWELKHFGESLLEEMSKYY